MVDIKDDGSESGDNDAFSPLNTRKIPKRQTAVAVQEGETLSHAPTITAAGRGVIAEKILELAFNSGIKVREDSALAEMLATVELDSPIPSEAFMAVAEVLGYVYIANGQKNPYDIHANIKGTS